SSARTSWAPRVSNVNLNSGVSTVISSEDASCAWGSSGAALTTSVVSSAGLSGAVAVGMAVSVTSADSSVEACSGAAVWLWGAAPNKGSLPLYTCQLFHNSSSENEKITQRMVRRMSILIKQQ